MKLSVADRLVLLSLLPGEGNIITLRLVQDLRASLGFSDVEITEGQICLEKGQVTYKRGAVADKEVEFGEAGKALIAKELKRLSKDGKLQPQHITLYGTFVDEDE